VNTYIKLQPVDFNCKRSLTLQDSNHQGVPLPQTKRTSRIETERRILHSARVLFARLGFDATPLKKIAEHSQVNEALIIRYFKAKAELLTAVIVEHLKKETVTYAAMPEVEKLEDEIYTYLSSWFESQIQHKDFLRIATSRASVDGKIRQEIQKHVPVNGDPILAKRLIKFKKSGEIPKKMDLFELSHSIGLIGLGVSFVVNMLPEFNKKLIDSSLRLHAETIAAGLREQAKKKTKTRAKNLSHLLVSLVD
jgi:AcrR family transcriptional regulator